MLYGLTIFLGAFLLFLIEPLFAKLILPWFGGSAAVWITCMVFFQAALLAGYLYAFAMSRFPLRTQRIVHTIMLTAALAFLPAIPGPRWQPDAGSAPAARLLAILIAVLGMPFFLLATTGPLLQMWSPKKSPYRLFALSNAGSLAALIAYPILIEPRFSTRAQDVGWSCGFALFAILCAAAAWTSNRQEAEPFSRSDSRLMLPWFALAAGGSMLLLATTNQLTQNVAAVPFLWALPLIVYLLSFILCFESSRWCRAGLLTRVVVFGFAIVAYTIYDIQLSTAIFIAIPVFLFGLFAGCMFCHGELSLMKPPKDQLAAFYLMIAAGGAAGAVFIGLIAPRIFSGVYELAVSMLFVCLLAVWMKQAWSERLLWSAMALTMAAVFAAQAVAYHRDARIVTRDFYGSLRVVESNGIRRLYHGTVEHGSQFIESSRRGLPTTYYGPESGAGLALRSCCEGSKNIGIVGLGVGTLAAYGRAGDRIRYYEINPEVARLARSEFSFLADSPAKIEIAIGDARLSLAREAPQQFDVLAIDAFSGDAIPVHLLTREALALYRRHLKPSGILAIHISNQYLDLAPVVARLAPGAIQVQTEKDTARDIAASTWMLVTANRSFLDRVPNATAPPPGPQWTDDYNNLFDVFRF